MKQKKWNKNKTEYEFECKKSHKVFECWNFLSYVGRQYSV